MQLLMEQQVALDDPLKTLSADYLNLFTNGQSFTDVTFCVEGRQVHAHRCILAARSTFFRMLFSNGDSMTELTGHSGGSTHVIPVGIVGYDVFLVLLHFLYSGQLILVAEHMNSKCHDRACWHAYCSSGVELALDTLRAADFFGVEQLSTLIQKQLATIVDKASFDDVMRVLLTAKKQELHRLWTTCSELVAKSGLTTEALGKHLPLDVVREIEDMRVHRGYGIQMANGRDNCGSVEEQRIRRMQQALDSLDVELVRLMVLGEGLNLDKAQALHYAVSHCSREVVKALLELGAVDVDYPSAGGRTALHLAAEMANPEMIAVLLDHHAAPDVRTNDGATPLDIVQSLAAVETGSVTGKTGYCKPDHSKFRLCSELLQSAAIVAAKEEESCEDAMTELSDNRSGLELIGSSTLESYSSPVVNTDLCNIHSICPGLPVINSRCIDPDTYEMLGSNMAKTVAISNGSLDGFWLPVYPDLRVPIFGASEIL
eukprot:c38885_g1_i1 orf=551-2008(+)